MKEQQIEFQYKGRYYQSGELNAQTQQVWFVLHGYGQLAKFFIQKFSILEQHHICCIAPEGLSKFYLEDIETRVRTGNNRVGATWMTSENRLVEIENYLKFLDAVYQVVMNNHQHLPVTILGFSQGAATASRWVINNTIDFSRLILWAGLLPPDMNFESGKSVLNNKEVIHVYGLNDPYINEKRVTEMMALSNKLGKSSKPVTFDGGHEIDEPTLLQLITSPF